MSATGLFVLALFWLGLLYVAALSMSCDDPDKLEKDYVSYSCYPANSTNTVRWTIVSASGTITDVGFCSGVYSNCTQSAVPGFSLFMPHFSRMYTSSLQRIPSGTIVCNEYFTNGTVDTTNCTLRVVSVRLGAYDKGYELQENNNYTNRLVCYVSDSSNPMIWSLVTRSGVTTHLATCYGISNCTSPLTPYVQARRDSSTSSYLTVTNINRETAGTLLCTDGKDTDNCTLDVQSYAEVGACGLQVHPANWSAVGSCSVTNVYSTFERFECYVSEQYTMPGNQNCQRYKYMSDGSRTIALVPYVNTTDGKRYFRGNYTRTWPLPHLDGTYVYSMLLFPSSYSHYNLDTIVIEHPMPASLQCESSSRETVRVACVCSTPSVGRPAGRLVWLSGITVLAAGQHGVTELHHNVTVGESGYNLTCQLDWILKSNVSVFIPVAATAVPSTLGVATDSSVMLAVGVYVTLGVILVVVVVVAVVLYRRRTLKGRPANDSPNAQLSQGRQLQENENGYTSLDMSQVVKRGKRTGAANTDNTPEQMYENTAMDNTI